MIGMVEPNKEDGTSYADVLINGVALDTSLHFDFYAILLL